MIYVLGIDWNSSSLAQREKMMVPESDFSQFLQDVAALPGARGCVLLQTCNRFELYLDAVDKKVCEALLPRFSGAFLLSDVEAQRRLMEVASGLRSQILGEDQIISQVRSAVKSAREAHATTPTLETLFRLAVTAGKAVRTKVKFCAVAPSSAKKAVELIEDIFGVLEGKRAVVIGNGEMGRLAAQHLLEAGCLVTMTLRSYRRGQTTVPSGCGTVAYADRLTAIEGCDVLVSATKSPHFTMTTDMFVELRNPPRVVVDLALPRDIETPSCPQSHQVFLDLDDLRDEVTEKVSDEFIQATAIIDKKLEDFEKWQQGRLRCRAGCAGGVAVFAGTSEGRALCEHLSSCDVVVDAFVATEYGSMILSETAGISVHTGRLDVPKMIEVLRSHATVIDATHPFAVQVSENICSAAKKTDTRYVRLVRPETSEGQSFIPVPNMEKAVDYLAQTEGPVLMTIGTKELEAFTKLPHFAERLYVRVLPEVSSLQHCKDLGFSPSHIIAMQGPFSYEMNLALMDSMGARYLVTKNTGDAGGFSQKLSAAEKRGVKAVVVMRPVEPVAGSTLDEVCTLLTGCVPRANAECARRFPLFVDLAEKRCLVVGGGRVGTRRCKALRSFGAEVVLITPEVHEQLEHEDLQVVRRAFTHGDTEGMTLVVAATNNRAVNALVAEECRKASIPVNVADNPDKCDFFFPALCTSQRLTAGVVGNGENHALVVEAAAAIRATLGGLDL